MSYDSTSYGSGGETESETGSALIIIIQQHYHGVNDARISSN